MQHLTTPEQIRALKTDSELCVRLENLFKSLSRGLINNQHIVYVLFNANTEDNSYYIGLTRDKSRLSKHKDLSKRRNSKLYTWVKESLRDKHRIYIVPILITDKNFAEIETNYILELGTLNTYRGKTPCIRRTIETITFESE